MDDALVQRYSAIFCINTWVLILVLMDDALVHGTCNLLGMQEWVLILVLMDDALVHGRAHERSASFPQVLILVLMDDALVPFAEVEQEKSQVGLNPCFNG